MLSNLSQVNVELLTIDKRTFTTDEGNSLQTLFGENSEGSAQYRAEVSTMAARLATVFASLKVGKFSVYMPSNNLRGNLQCERPQSLKICSFVEMQLLCLVSSKFVRETRMDKQPFELKRMLSGPTASQAGQTPIWCSCD